MILSDDFFQAFEYSNPIYEADIRKALGQRRRRHKVFCHTVHDLEESGIHANSFVPGVRILCRPRREGKTTELQYIRYLFAQYRPIDARRRLIQIDLDSRWRSLTRRDLFELICRRLRVKAAPTFTKAIENTGPYHVLILIDNIEFLSEDALTWLLASANEIDRRKSEFELQSQFNLVLAGNLGLDYISREIWSVYYTSEVSKEVRGYGVKELVAISEYLRGFFGVGLDLSLQEEVYEYTQGSKRIANLLLGRTWEGYSQEHGKGRGEITCDFFRRVRDRYMNLDFRTDEVVHSVLEKMVEAPSSLSAMKNMLKTDEVSWATLPSSTQKFLFKENLVAITRGHARIKNKFWKELFTRRFSQKRSVSLFLSRFLPRGRPLPKASRERRGVLHQVARSGAFTGSSIGVFYGQVVRVLDDGLGVEITSLDGHAYVLDLPTDFFGFVVQLGSCFIKHKFIDAGVTRVEYHFHD